MITRVKLNYDEQLSIRNRFKHSNRVQDQLVKTTVNLEVESIENVLLSPVYGLLLFLESSENLSFPKCPTFVLRVEMYWADKTVLLPKIQ